MRGDSRATTTAAPIPTAAYSTCRSKYQKLFPP